MPIWPAFPQRKSVKAYRRWMYSHLIAITYLRVASLLPTWNRCSWCWTSSRRRTRSISTRPCPYRNTSPKTTSLPLRGAISTRLPASMCHAICSTMCRNRMTASWASWLCRSASTASCTRIIRPRKSFPTWNGSARSTARPFSSVSIIRRRRRKTCTTKRMTRSCTTWSRSPVTAASTAAVCAAASTLTTRGFPWPITRHFRTVRSSKRTPAMALPTTSFMISSSSRPGKSIPTGMARSSIWMRIRQWPTSPMTWNGFSGRSWPAFIRASPAQPVSLVIMCSL